MSEYEDYLDLLEEFDGYPLSEEECITLIEIIEERLKSKFNKTLEWKIT